MSWWNAVLPVLTLVLGAALTMWSESRRESQGAKRSAAERAEAAQAARLARRENFELEHLLDVHKGLKELVDVYVRRSLFAEEDPSRRAELEDVRRHAADAIAARIREIYRGSVTTS